MRTRWTLPTLGAHHRPDPATLARHQMQGPYRLAPGPDEFSYALFQSTGVELASGHDVQVVQNGAVFDVLVDEIRRAERSVHILVYIWRPSPPSDRIIEALLERARAGVRCRIVVDPVGSEEIAGDHDFDQAVEGRLTRGGCEVHYFRLLGNRRVHRMLGRDHQKLAVVDGRVGVTGGFGIWKVWQGHGATPEEWRDTHVRVEGPAVRQMQLAFASTWQEAGGELLPRDAFPPLMDGRANGRGDGHANGRGDGHANGRGDGHANGRGDGHANGRADGHANGRGDWAADGRGDGARAAYVSSHGRTGITVAERATRMMIAAATKRLWIANAYFTPPDAILRQLEEKVRQGVDVRVLAAGPIHDVPIILAAQRSTYERLLRGGVRIWEYQPSMMHSKTLLVDDWLSCIGSTNLDAFSLNWTGEGSLVVDAPAVAAELERQWHEDAARSEEITLERGGRTGPWRRIARRVMMLVARD